MTDPPDPTPPPVPLEYQPRRRPSFKVLLLFVAFTATLLLAVLGVIFGFMLGSGLLCLTASASLGATFFLLTLLGRLEQSEQQ